MSTGTKKCFFVFCFLLAQVKSLAPIPESEEEFEEQEEEFEEQGEEFEDNTEVMLERENKKESMGEKYSATSNIRRDQKVELG